MSAYNVPKLLTGLLDFLRLPNEMNPSNPIDTNAIKNTPVVTAAPTTPASTGVRELPLSFNARFAALDKIGLSHVPQPRSCTLLHTIHH